MISRARHFGVRWQSEAATPLWMKILGTQSLKLEQVADPKRRRRFALPAHSKSGTTPQ